MKALQKGPWEAARCQHPGIRTTPAAGKALEGSGMASRTKHCLGLGYKSKSDSSTHKWIQQRVSTMARAQSKQREAVSCVSPKQWFTRLEQLFIFMWIKDKPTTNGILPICLVYNFARVRMFGTQWHPLTQNISFCTSTSLKKEARLVRHDLPLINPPWLLPVIFFFCSYKSPQGDALYPLLKKWDKVELLVCSSPNPSFALPEN